MDSPTNPGSCRIHSIDSKANWMANSEDVDHFKVTGNAPLSSLLLSLKNLLGPRHFTESSTNTFLNQLKDVQFTVTDELQEELSKKRNVEYAQVFKRLDNALQVRDQWPQNDSAWLQKMNLP